jgi:branched-chain amino acid transport system substrate-binding protein
VGKILTEVSDDPESKKGMSRREALAVAGGLIIGGVVGAGASMIAAPPRVAQQMVTTTATGAKPSVPSTNLKVGCQSFLKGPNAPQGEPLPKGVDLAVNEINAAGGILGRKIELITRDEGPAVDDTVKEYRREVLEDKIDFYIGLVSSSSTPAVAPVAEELGVITLFVDGCTDTVFDVIDPYPKVVFRNHIQSPDGISMILQEIRQFRMKNGGKDPASFVHIHPDYAYGRLVYAHSALVAKTVLPASKEVIAPSFVTFPGTTDFSSYITKTLDAKPDVVVSSEWGGDFLAFYKQALGYGFFKSIPIFGSTLSHGAYPGFIGTDFPEGLCAGCHSNYWFQYPSWDLAPVNKSFASSFNAKYGEYPNFEAEGAYTMAYAYKGAVEVAAKLKGGWPSTQDIVSVLENWVMVAPSSYWFIRKDNHEGYKDVAIVGISKNDAKLGMSTVSDMYGIPTRFISAPADWQHTQFDAKADPVNRPTATSDWVYKQWTKGAWPQGVPP